MSEKQKVIDTEYAQSALAFSYPGCGIACAEVAAELPRGRAGPSGLLGWFMTPPPLVEVSDLGGDASL